MEVSLGWKIEIKSIPVKRNRKHEYLETLWGKYGFKGHEQEIVNESYAGVT